MSYQIGARIRIVGAFAAALIFVSAGATHAQPAAGACDRGCLRQALDAYLAAVFKHDPAAARLTDNHYATENTAIVPNGQGFWKDVSGYSELQRRYLDPVNETAAFFGLLKKDGKDTIVSVRILVEGTKVSEAEWIVGSQGPGGNGEANPPGLLKYPPPSGALPASERSPRFIMISVANDYFQAVVGHEGAWVPNDSECIRIENGGGTGAKPPPKGQCLDNFANFKHLTKDLALRRFPVVDEQAGVILGTAIYVRYPGTGRRDNLVHEYFFIRNGKIAGIWTSMYFLPLGSPVTSGWENRQGGVER